MDSLFAVRGAPDEDGRRAAKKRVKKGETDSPLPGAGIEPGKPPEFTIFAPYATA